MDAAADSARREGADVVPLPGFLRGEARDCARAFCDRLGEPPVVRCSALLSVHSESVYASAKE